MEHFDSLHIPQGSYVMHESFTWLLSLLDNDADELAVRRAMDAFAYNRPLPEMSEQAWRAFNAIVAQLAANKK